MLLGLTEFFQSAADISILLIFALLLVSFAVLGKGADWFVDGASSIARGFGVPKAIIGATIVSIGTTSSEAAVSVMAAFQGRSGLALGNGIGSVICNIALIFGLCVLLSNIPSDRFTVKRQGIIMLASSVLLAGTAYLLSLFGIHLISRTFGFILLGLLALYCVLNVRWAREHKESFAALVPKEAASITQKPTPKFIMTSALLFLMGLVLVIIGSRGLVGSIEQIVLYFGIPEAVVATTVVAFGTSVPELATGVASILKGHKEILLGNILGANVLNILFVIGAAASVRAIEIPASFYTLHFPVMLIVIGVFMAASFVSKTGYRRMLGLPLLAIYAFYVIVQYLTYTPVAA